MEGGLLLTAIMALPLVGALVVMLLPVERPGSSLGAGLTVTGTTFVLSLALLVGFKPGVTGMQFAMRVPWFEEQGIAYHIGLDGISLFLVLLTTFIMPIVLINAWSSVRTRVREYVAAMLVLETGMIGAFVALDLILFYIFWEVMLIPMYFIVGIWGGPRRVYAAVKFFLFTMTGSMLMLAAILYLGLTTEPRTFDLLALYDASLTTREQWYLFLAFAAAFAVKVPMFPLHTWLPDAHVEAPTGGSVVLAAVLLKFGTYGFLRFAMPLFPQATSMLVSNIALLAVVGIIYGSLVAMAQSDMKKLVAYSSVAHLGFVMLGLAARTPEGVTGAIYQMLSHGISTGALFLAVGVIYERRHTRDLAQLGGIARPAPIYAALTGIVVLSSIALPGTNGFVGEFLILAGTYVSTDLPWQRGFTIAAATGVVLGAIYMLAMFRKVMLGPLTRAENEHVRDVSLREIVMFAPLVVMIIVMGVFPGFFVDRMETSVIEVLRRMDARSVRLMSPDGAAAAAVATPREPAPRLPELEAPVPPGVDAAGRPVLREPIPLRPELRRQLERTLRQPGAAGGARVTGGDPWRPLELPGRSPADTGARPGSAAAQPPSQAPSRPRAVEGSGLRLIRPAPSQVQPFRPPAEGGE